jgi:uncharacterized RDD family membrane protein YckC
MNDPINPYAPPQANIIPESNPDQAQRLASPWRRLGAALLDSIILMVIFMPLMWVGGYFARSMERAAKGQSWDMEQLLWSAVGFGIMIAINWNHLGRGQTIGKGVMQLRIVRKDGASADRQLIILKRLLPIQLIALVPYLGGLFALVDSLCIFRAQHNTLHDDIAATKVIDLRPQIPVS